MVLPGGLSGALLRVEGETAPVGFIESGKAPAAWSIEVNRPYRDHPPGASEAPSLQRRAVYWTAERLGRGQAEEWAAVVVGSKEGIEPGSAWAPSGSTDILRAQIPEGGNCVLARAQGRPTAVGEAVLGEVEGAQWVARFDGWHLRQKPSCKNAGPIYTQRMYATKAALPYSEAEEWALRTAESEELAISRDPLSGPATAG